MYASKGIRACAAQTFALLLGVFFPAAGQGMQYVIHSETRVFPTVGPGVAAMKRDAAGNYYILAEPANTIYAFDGAGRPKGQIPSVNSGGATLRYAVSMDVDSQGNLYIADRGGNAVRIFAPDGALVANVPVTAPTSVVALSDGQFAVTKLQSKRLVEIMDRTGRTIRTFGDPADMGAPNDGARFSQPTSSLAQPVAVVDRGRITGDGHGNIYFAFTSLADPALERFDRYGYSAYDSLLPSTDFGALSGTRGRDIELGYTMSGMTGPESITAWTDLHSVKASAGRSPGGRRRPGPGPDNSATGAGGANAENSGGSSATDSGTSAIAGDSSEFDGEILSYDAQSASANSGASFLGTSGMGALGPSLRMPGMMGMGFGDPFRMGGWHGGGFAGEGLHADSFGGRPGAEGLGHFHPGGYSTYRASATLRVALDDPSKHQLEKPLITAVTVDPQTQEAWTAIGDMLVHLDSNGNRLDTYYMTIRGETTIKASAILVESDRILIASDSWGIYEFPRPDK